MPKNYVYRMHHDTGFAPNIKYKVCTLSGCKNSKCGWRKNIEESAEPGSWVLGIGGKRTKQANKLIYVMEVEKNLLYDDFIEKYSSKHKEYEKIAKEYGPKPATNVLVSKNFYYFGDKAIDLPKSLDHLIIDRHGYWLVEDKDINILKKHLTKIGKKGVIGKPNNPFEEVKCRECNTSK